MNIQKSLYTARWAGAHSDSQALPLQGTGESLTVEACPTSQGWTDRRKQLQKWLPSNTFPACPRPGLSAEFQVHRDRKGNSELFPTQKKIRTFFLLGGEKVLVPSCHTLALTKVTAGTGEPSLSQTPTSHL